ncbi:preprotein translocase subunit SecG [Hymenobacter taeanensis]|uniref:Protein-export membrane protein SecG n=1 Tax=Hymenobacter taeanensis TaxID=2735321 RepID=A0A6M6BLU3_9BACT|nr:MULTISPECIES: preprotein translocase subunit SecG [Hymenobacter]QJX48798.1 preprotein translocase subunit SecG [Hymenobacter taeanensis]UOQ81695.1 preprotein translocase subunit SecG [Hymenobacter sp. 5414T-23]
MYITLVVLILFVCLLLGLVVLAQNPKGGGISSQFGAGGAAQLMGVKRTGDLLERLTWGLAIALIVLSLGTHVVGDAGTGPVRSVNQQKALETRIPTTPAPVGPGAPGTTVPGAAAPGTAPATAPAAPVQQPASTPAQ